MANRKALDRLAMDALEIGDVQSAALFVIAASGQLELVAAAGIEGPPLEGLILAVRDPAHPVARAVSDPGPTFDVRPMNPGGPALRSHVPLRIGARTVGVLALAHDRALSPDDRARVLDASRRAAELLARSDAPA